MLLQPGRAERFAAKLFGDELFQIGRGRHPLCEQELEQSFQLGRYLVRFRFGRPAIGAGIEYPLE